MSKIVKLKGLPSKIAPSDLYGVVWVDEEKGSSVGVVKAPTLAEARAKAAHRNSQVCHVYPLRQKSEPSGPTSE